VIPKCLQQLWRYIAFVLLLSVGTTNAVCAQQGSAWDVRTPTYAAGQPHLLIESADSTGMLHITVGRSVIFRSAKSLSRIYVGNPAVIRSFTSTPSEIVVTGKLTGISSLVLWEITGKHSLYTVSVDPDPAALQASLDEAFPGAKLRADASQGRLSISGAVPDASYADGVLKLASLYSNDIINSLRVVPVHGKQVQLKLRIVEVDRTKMEQFGVNIFHGGSLPGSVSTGQYSSGTTTSAGIGSALSTGDPLNLFLYSASQNIGATVKDLEQKQILQVLAEPTLTTLSGHTARFLSGGEFPFPVVQGGAGGTAASVTIMFRPFGVKVDFTPTVTPDGSICLTVNPEVSTLDYSNAVTISGFTVPALSTRRAETEVELRNGQSFVVSGLLDHRTTDNFSKIPGIASIPILGELFRSKSLQHSVVELVVIVTATIVDPLSSREPVVEPKMAVPNMERSAFDAQVNESKKNAASTPRGH
jgi:pilus assembly protein CpaC